VQGVWAAMNASPLPKSRADDSGNAGASAIVALVLARQISISWDVAATDAGETMTDRSSPRLDRSVIILSAPSRNRTENLLIKSQLH
jgi:hypothetical protein